MNDLLERIQPLTKQSPARLLALVDALRSIDDRAIAGDIVECGVWQGASIIIARLICPQRICWAYDTFDGMTEPTQDDVSMHFRSAISSYNAKKAAGRKWNACSLEQVIENLKAFGVLDMTKLRFVVGDVCQTTVNQHPERIALLRLDTDWHASTLAELAYLYPKLERGGVLIVDDYGHWAGARMAVNQFFGWQPFDQPHWNKVRQLDDTGILIVR